VIALDTSPVRLALARHNAALYGVADRIEFILADFLSFADRLAQLQERRNPQSAVNETSDGTLIPSLSRKIDVVFLSPPWGGPSYLTDQSDAEKDAAAQGDTNSQIAPEYSLASIRPVHGKELFQIARRLTKNIAYFLPRNVNLHEVADLLQVNVLSKEGDSAGNDESEGRATMLDGKGETAKEKNDDKDMVEVEEEWMGSKLKALTCYFGGLVAGQENRFYA